MNAVVGAVDVLVRADMAQYDAAMARGKQEALAFDKAASGSMAHVQQASAKMGTGVATDATKIDKSLEAAVAEIDRFTKHLAMAGREAQTFGSTTSRASTNVVAFSKQTASAATDLGSFRANLNGALEGLLQSVPGMGRAEAAAGRLGGAIGPRGVAGGLIRVGAGAAMAAPLVAGVVAVLVAGAVAGWQFYESQVEVERVLGGVGRASGATAGDIEALAIASANAGEASTTAAREMALSFASTGRIGVELFDELIAISREYAITMGVDSKAATEQLGAAFANPIKGAEDLNAKLSFLDDTTMQYIRNLVEQNRTTEAQRVLLHELEGALDGAAEHTHVLARAWDAVARSAANAWDWMGRAVNRGLGGASDAEKLSTLQTQKAAASRMPGGAIVDVAILGKTEAQIDREIAALQTKITGARNAADAARIDAERNRTSIAAGEAVRGLLPTDQQIQSKRNQIKVIQDAAARGLVNAEQAKRAIAAANKDIADLQKPKGAGRSGRTGPSAEERLAERLREEAEAMRVNTKGAIDLANAYLQSGDAALEAEARRKGLTRAVRSGAEAEDQVRRQLALDIAEQAVAGAKQTAQLELEAAAQRATNDAVAAGLMTREQSNRINQQEAALRPLLAAQALAEGEAKATLTTIIERLRKAYGELNTEQERAAGIQLNQGARDQIAMLELELSLIGKTNEERRAAIAQLEALQRLKQAGVDPNSAAGKEFLESTGKRVGLEGQIDTGEFMERTRKDMERATASLGDFYRAWGLSRQEASRYAKEQELVNAALDAGVTLTDEHREALAQMAADYASAEEAAKRFEEQQDMIAQAAGFVRDEVSGALVDIIGNSKSASDALGDLARALGEAALQALLMGQGPFGGMLGGGFGAGSDPTTGAGTGILGKGGAISNFASSAMKWGGNFLAGIFHGGTNSVGPASTQRSVPARVFVNAPRLHDGLSPDEFPAILQRGERVQSRREVAMGRGSTIVNMTVVASDAGSFRRNDRQIARGMKERFGV